jgi:hypothetical protein
MYFIRNVYEVNVIELRQEGIVFASYLFMIRGSVDLTIDTLSLAHCNRNRFTNIAGIARCELCL